MLSDLLHRLRAFFRHDTVERELDEEVSFHLEQQVDVYLRAGLSRDEAVRRARLEFGGLDQIKEAHRDARGSVSSATSVAIFITACRSSAGRRASVRSRCCALDSPSA